MAKKIVAIVAILAVVGLGIWGGITLANRNKTVAPTATETPAVVEVVATDAPVVTDAPAQ